MLSGNYFEDNPDLRFNLQRCLDWDRIVARRERSFRDAKRYQQEGDERFALAPADLAQAQSFYFESLQLAGEFAGKRVAPCARSMEQHGLKLKNGSVQFPPDYARLYQEAADSGFLSFPLPREWGGLNFPLPVSMALKEMLTRADNSFEISVAVSFLADVLRRFGPEDLKQLYIPQIVSGQLSAAMALTEPDYGSDLAHVRTRAELQADGSYRISGAKRFITHGCGVGDRPAILFTLARTSGDGARGLSFFLVHGKDVEVSRIEHKLGLVCSPTCEIVYDNAPAVLIGREGEGLIKYVMSMLNGGRMGVAVESVGISQAALSEARKYASERKQFGAAIETHPAVARMLDEMDARLQANRALVFQAAQYVELYEQRCEELIEAGHGDREIRRDEEASRLDRISHLWTSLAKLECSEGANRIAYDAMQIHGGVGFTEEFDIARIFRDARISTIYEGTSQIHINAALAAFTSGLGERDVVHLDFHERIENLGDDSRKEQCRALYQRARAVAQCVLQLARSERDYLARDAVESVAAALATALLAAQCDLLEGEWSGEFAERKRKAFEVYLRLARQRVAAAQAALPEPAAG
ncbi:MAG: acyl-CoA dehydrogenase family protein [Leptospirales bacterium]|nr:acyl-CoA dehydrogenase family protein [Leptospirales bacterium]